jgi:hypothetical protein
MHEKERVADLVCVRERAKRLMRQAGETSDAWFAEQLRQLARDLTEYAESLEVGAQSQKRD